MEKHTIKIILLIFLSFQCLAKPQTGASSGFLFFGDSGTGEPAQFLTAGSMSRYCTKHPCQFVLALGDNFLPRGVSSTSDPKWKTHFLDPYRALQLVFFPVLGNHDYQGNVQAQLGYTQESKWWHMPSRFYSFEKEGVQLIALDTNQFDEEQGKWLNQVLSSSNAFWKIVYGHHPILSYGQHGNTSELIKELLPIIKGKADFYLSGHDHDRQVIIEQGQPVYVVSGAAAQTRPTGSGKGTVFSSSTLGFGHFLFKKDNVTLSLVDGDGKVDFQKEFSKKNSRTASP
ncbi:MAG: metallophosphoesterase [Deltaproteobacteria bacterium]|nr:metallophosphoesterase [Deltaproteobacteria bacterium]